MTYPLARWNDNIAMAKNMMPMMVNIAGRLGIRFSSTNDDRYSFPSGVVAIDATKKKVIATKRSRIPESVCRIAKTITPKGLFRVLERFAFIQDASFSSRGIILFVFCAGIHLPEMLIVAAGYGRIRQLIPPARS